MNPIVTAERYHDISCGHRVVGHEGKCQHLHGHNYRIHFKIGAQQLDDIGRVLDFSVIKSKLCMWLEENWDHKFLAWDKDPVMKQIHDACWESGAFQYTKQTLSDSIVWVPFNPTAENMGLYLLNVVGLTRLRNTGCKLLSVTVEETRKCAATVEL